MPNRARPIAVARTAGAAATLAVLLGGCSLPVDDGEPAIEARVLSAREVRSALLRPRDIGAGFRVEPTSSSPGTSSGCLFGQEAMRRAGLSRFRGVHEREIDFVARGDLPLPAIHEYLATTRTVAEAETVVRSVSTLVRRCHRATFSSPSGKLTLTVTSSNAPATADVDEQLNIAATGRIPVPGGRSVPFGVWLSLVRIENHLLLLGYIDAGGEAGTITRVTAAALARFVPVARGQEPATPPSLGLSPTRPEALAASAS